MHVIDVHEEGGRTKNTCSKGGQEDKRLTVRKNGAFTCAWEVNDEDSRGQWV